MKATQTQEYMQQMAALMTEALNSPEGLRALAAAIAPPIEQAIAVKEISTLLLSKHVLPKGESAKYQKKPTVKAYWISSTGEARESEVGKDEVTAETHRIASEPLVDVDVLKTGNIGSLMDIQQAAADEIRKETDKRTITVISAAVPSANVVHCYGGALTEGALNEAISILEDLELQAKWVVMRGRRFNDCRGWELDPQTDNELRVKGAIKNWGTATFLLTSTMALDEVLVHPTDEIGKMPVKSELATEPINLPTRFKTGWLVWQEIGHIVTRPEITVKITIHAEEAPEG